jgi:putative ABC transport system permease protein
LRIQDLVRFAWKALSDRKLRASLTILGLVIGPATIVALVGATQGLSNGVTAQFSKTGATSIFLTPAQRGVSFTSADVSVLQAMPGVATVVPFYLFSGTVAQGTQTTPVQILAGDFSKINQVFPGLSIEQGLEPTASDLGGAAIGNTLAYPKEPGIPNFTINNIVPVSFGGGSFGASFGGEGVRFFSATGSASSSGSRSFIVRGVFTPFGQGFFVNPDTGIFIPLAAGQSILHSNKFTGIVVVASSPGTVDQVTSEISAHYGQQVRTISVSSILSTIQSIIGGIGTFLGAIGGISVLVAFIGIMTTMFTTVVERTKEIGILKALGYSSRNVLSIFLVEASVTGFAGGLIGSAVGAVLSFALVPLFSSGFAGGGGPRTASASSSLTIVPAISPELILLAVGLATGVGMLAGLLPAWRASRLPPVDALRQE